MSQQQKLLTLLHGGHLLRHSLTGVKQQAQEQLCTTSRHHVSLNIFRQTSTASPVFSFGRLLNDYKQLSKFKLTSLVVLTAGAGYVAGSGDTVDWKGFGWTTLGTFGAAACANTLNQLYEVANDRMMTRTGNRPLPRGRLSRVHAAAFAVACGATGLGILYHQTNGLTTALGAANIALYAAVYTPLKQISMANTWVGAVVGAIPPLMGWASAAGQLEAGSWVLATALFFWQMPHFLALAWMCKDDYIRGGFKMISMFDPTGRRTALCAMRHCAYIAPIGLLAYLAEITTQPFAWEAAGLAAYLSYGAAKFTYAPSLQSARKLFKTSLVYLPLLLLLAMVHRVPNQHTMDMEGLLQKLTQLLESLGLAELAVGAGLGVSSAGARLSEALIAKNIRCPSKAFGDSDEIDADGKLVGRSKAALLDGDDSKSQG